MKRLFISFSGGETSGYMTKLLQSGALGRYDEIITVFANTGDENDETLDFVHQCDEAFGFNTVWIEADPQRGNGKVTHKVVTYETASRNAEPFEEMIKLYGIPNVDFPMCTRELKTRPMRSYIREIGWDKYEFDTAVGIRADESNRRSKNPGSIVYPLLDWLPTTKPEVNSFWRDQSFRLNLAGYQGNCKSCWKKSTRKLLTIMEENPSAFDFFERMENTHGLVGPEFAKLHKYKEGYKRTFFRKHISVTDLRKMVLESGWEKAENDAVVYESKIVQLDLDLGCVDSCEVDFNEEVM